MASKIKDADIEALRDKQHHQLLRLQKKHRRQAEELQKDHEGSPLQRFKELQTLQQNQAQQLQQLQQQHQQQLQDLREEEQMGLQFQHQTGFLEEDDPFDDEEKPKVKVKINKKNKNKDKDTPEKKVKDELSWLKNLGYLEIRQQHELLEMQCCCETANKYFIYKKNGQHIAEAREQGRSCRKICCRNFCLNRRSFTIMVKSLVGGPSFTCHRRFNPCVGCCPPCIAADKLKVKTVDGGLISSCHEGCTCIRPRYRIEDDQGAIRYTVLGPWCQLWCCCCCKRVTFWIKDAKGEKVGKIYKKWGGIVKEIYTDADTFVLEIDPTVSVRDKASLVGLTFLIDFMFFEDNNLKKKVDVNNTANVKPAV